MELSIDELRSNNIVHIVIDGTAHFSVVREITETSVKLSDPKLGNIEMTREKFSEIFTGNALVISNPNVNGTMNQTNQSVEDTDTYELEKLASEDMLTIQGGGGVNRVVWHWWGCIVYICNINTHTIVNAKGCVALIMGLLKVPKPVAVLIGVSAIALRQVNIRNTGVIVWVTWLPRIRIFRIAAQ